eukprot:2854233-Rhodomonas_salina.3
MSWRKVECCMSDGGDRRLRVDVPGSGGRQSVGRQCSFPACYRRPVAPHIPRAELTIGQRIGRD